MNIYPPGSAYLSSDYSYQNQSHPSTPIYHFAGRYPLQSSYGGSSENIAAAGAGPGYGGMSHGGSQYGGTQYEYANSNGQSDYLQSPHSQYGVQRHPYASSDRSAAPRRRGSIESAESRISLAYLSGDRVAMDPTSPLPDAIPSLLPTQTTPRRTGKGGLIVHNNSPTELHQHEDGGVRLDVHRSGSQQQQVIELPPVYKPSY